MDKAIRVITLIYITFASMNFANPILSGRGDKKVDLIILGIGLIGAAILLATDIVQKNKRKKIHFYIKPIDYFAIILWVSAILLSYNKLYVGRLIREIFDLKSNPVVYQVIELFIALLFLAAFGALAMAMLKFGRLKNRSYPLKFIVLFISCVSLILALVAPIDTVRFGSCGGLPTTRLSLLGGDKQQFENFKQEANDKALKREQSRKAMQSRGIYIAEGCSIGPSYVLYLL